MLHELKELSKRAKIKLVIDTDENDQMTIIVFMELNDKNGVPMNVAPLRVIGNVNEMQSELARTIELYAKKTIGTVERIDFVTKSLSKAEKEVTASNKKKTTSKPEKKKEEGGLFDIKEEKTSAKTLSKKESKERTEAKNKATAEVVSKATKEVGTLEAKGGFSTPTYTTKGTLTGKITEDVADVIIEEREAKLEQRSDKMVSRINRIVAIGFREKPEEKEFVRGGIGIATTFLEKSEDDKFEEFMTDMKTKIEESKKANKPMKSFSEFQTEEVKFETPVPASVPVPIPVQKVKTVDELYKEVIELAREKGYDPNTIALEGATIEFFRI